MRPLVANRFVAAFGEDDPGARRRWPLLLLLVPSVAPLHPAWYAGEHPDLGAIPSFDHFGASRYAPGVLSSHWTWEIGLSAVLANLLVVAGGTAVAVALGWRPTGGRLRGEEFERDLESPLARDTAPLEPEAGGASGPAPASSRPIVCGVPRFAASHTLAAPPEDVWAFLAEPDNLPRWWPGIAAVEPGRRRLAPGARWRVAGPNRPSYLRRPEMNGTLLVLEAVPRERVAFQLVDDRIDVELDLRALDGDRAEASLVVEAPWLAGVRRSFPHAALARLADRIAESGRPRCYPEIP